MATQKVCAQCKSVTEPVGYGCVEVVCLLFLLLLGLIPGIIYAIWVDSRAKACKVCGAKALVPLDSPRGKEIIGS